MCIITYKFGDLKLQKPESKAFAQMFQKNYGGKILECHLQLLNPSAQVDICLIELQPYRAISLQLVSDALISLVA